MIGSGPILYGSRPGAPAGFVNIAGARDGVSLDSDNFVTLGQLAGSGSAGPGILTDSREIPFGANNLELGITADTGFLTIGAFATLFNNNSGVNEGFFIPINNIAPSGLLGLDAGMYTAEQTLDFTTGDGVASDFRSFSNWNPSGGATNFASFYAEADIIQTGSTGDFIAFFSKLNIQPTGGTGIVRGFYHLPTLTNVGIMGHIAIENVSGDVRLNSGIATPAEAGHTSIRMDTTATAFLHIGASTGAAGDGPLKLTPGTLLGTPETGLFEFDGTHLYFTIGATRNTLI